MKYNGVIERKLSLLADQVIMIRTNIGTPSFEEFDKNWLLVAGSERALQVAVEIMIDIAERILALEKAGPAAYAADAMKKLEALGVIKSAETYTQMVKFRNLIVHEYEEIDHKVLYDVIVNRLGDFDMFRDEIDAFNNR